MATSWILIIAGVVFCLGGVFLFQQNAFEENKKILFPVLVMLAGVVLIGLGTAKNLGLVD